MFLPRGLLAWLVLLPVLAGCGGDPTNAGDTTPPAEVADLTLLSVSDTTAILSWTAPGDDGRDGAAAAYDVRHHRMTFDLVSWSSATPLTGLPAPRAAGAAETLFVTHLLERRTYIFALKARDEAGNWSERSNEVRAFPSDRIPPAAITDLAATDTTEHSVTLIWTASGDDGSMFTASGHLVGAAFEPVTETVWKDLTPLRHPGPPVPAGETMTFTLTDLVSAADYWFAVRAVDDGGNHSPLSNVLHVRTRVDLVPPAPVADLEVSASTHSSASLRWTAPGDDGNLGTAASYDIRYALAPITGATWPFATRITPLPSPAAAGELQLLNVLRLSPRTEYHFALTATDEVGNTSALSNVASTVTAALPDTSDGIWVVRAVGPADVRTIQAAIDLAHDHDIILVGPGVYTEPFDYGDKDVTVVSEAGPEATILDGSSLTGGPLVRSGPGTSLGAVLDGFTIRGCRGDRGVWVYRGGLVFVRNIVTENPTVAVELIGSTVLVTECRFSNNDSWTDDHRRFGAALSIHSGWDGGRETQVANVRVENNIFESNRAGFGPGVHIGSGNLVLRDNLFRDNWCQYDGGAVFMWPHLGQALIEDNEFRDNEAGDHGGAIAVWHVYSGRSEIRGNLFVRNLADGLDSGGVNGTGGALHVGGVNGVVEYNTFVENDGHYDCRGGAIGLNPSPYGPTRDWLVRRNIVVGSRAGGISCVREYGTLAVGENLLFDNAGCDPVTCSPGVQSGNFTADPLFCDPAAGDYRLRADSPALRHPAGPLGAFPEPGCPAPDAAASAGRGSGTGR